MVPTDTKPRPPTMDSLLEGVEEILNRRLPTTTDVVIPQHQEVIQAPEWLTPFNKWASGLPQAPTHTEIIEVHQDNSYSLLPRAEVDRIVNMQRAGILSPIEGALNPLVPRVPLGSIAVGSTFGLIIGEIVDGLVPGTTGEGNMNVMNIFAKTLAAGGVFYFGGQLFSRQAALFAVGVLGAQVLADILPLDTIVDTVVGWFSGAESGNRFRQPQNPGGGHQPAGFALAGTGGTTDQIDSIFG